MIIASNQTSKKKNEGLVQNSRSYSEVIEYLNSCKSYEYGEQSLERMKALDKAFGNISKKIETIIVGGTNGKSSAISFACKLLKEEGFKVGSLYSSHFLVYNERLCIDSSCITNKAFTHVADEVISVAEVHKIDATAFEIMIMAALLYFKNEKIDVAILEVTMGGRFDATAICTPLVAAITRVTPGYRQGLDQGLEIVAQEMLGIGKKDTWLVSAEQSKLLLQKMKTWAQERGIRWTMPIRKLTAFPYIYEQLYGRIASLGEKIAQIYVEDVKGKFSPFLRGNLLATKRGQRGRPTLEAKRQSELNPMKTLKSFWEEHFELLRGRFEILKTEKPTILLDNAKNIDALTNVFLGIRLMHYQKPLKGFVLILALRESVDITESIKLIRYLFKKVPGQVFFIPMTGQEKNHEVNDIMTVAKELNLKAKGYVSFAEAFKAASVVVDQRNGLVCITGSSDIVAQYWKNRQIKKLQ